ncbi:TPA: hypothetical protein J0587_004610 [Salmonella enterica subsp. enterica serovar Kentucky]|nr:hypothetical protein [Salmonella enterica subsp. enterica serovar Kentucky]
MDKYELSFNEWHEKTNWVQDDKRFDVLLPWGKHRADVMKEYIDLLESRVADMAVQLANAESKCRELAAENAALNKFIAASCFVQAGEELAWYPAIDHAPETPATDAFLAEVREQGVEMFADHLLCPNLDDTIRDFAAQLRKGVQS